METFDFNLLHTLFITIYFIWNVVRFVFLNITEKPFKGKARHFFISHLQLAKIERDLRASNRRPENQPLEEEE